VFDLRFESQAALVVRCLPEVAKQDCFALKGGTAINLFVRDLPRVSVDIDLTYQPLKPRDESLEGISTALLQIKADIEDAVRGSRVSERYVQGFVAKLSVAADGVEIKVEPNLVLRGCVGAPVLRELSSAAQSRFRAGARIMTLADADLYGGKLCAALDRQHPRDLFDVRLLLKNEGITPAIRRAFVVYLASHTRPMHELLQPNLIDITDAFERQFIGMTLEPVTIDELVDARQQLVDILVPSLDDSERTFLLSIKSGDPDWSVLGIENLERMPALQWKLINIRKMDAGKREEQFEMLQDLLGTG
jgi:predicted nucleotidyltransferase component of viral defense system